jgi:hypothetical protein
MAGIFETVIVLSLAIGVNAKVLASFTQIPARATITL